MALTLRGCGWQPIAGTSQGAITYRVEGLPAGDWCQIICDSHVDAVAKWKVFWLKAKTGVRFDCEHQVYDSPTEALAAIEKVIN